MTQKATPVLVWRILVLLSLVANVFAITAPGVSNNNLVGSGFHPSLFTPANYSLTAWIVVFISFVGYAVWQLLPYQRMEEICNRLAAYFIPSNLLSMAWLVAFRQDWIIVSFIISAILLWLSVRMYFEVRNAVLKNEYSSWLSVPFSIHAALLSVGVLTNLTLVFVSLGWSTFSLQLIMALSMMIGVSALAIRVGYRCGDIVFPLTISWMCIGIYSAHQEEYALWGMLLVTFAVLPVLWTVITLINRIAHRHRIRSGKLSYPA